MTSDENPLLLQGSSLNRPPVRLREGQESLPEPSARWAVSMVRAAKPYDPGRDRQERIWAGLQAAISSHEPRSRRPGWLRFAFAVTLLLIAGLFVSAAMAQWPVWLARAIRGASTEERSHPPTWRTANADRAASPPASPLIAAPKPAAMPPRPTAEAPSRSRSRIATPEESQILLEAMRALRVEHSPGHARTLLTAYLRRHPKGALAEEALVMLVEAAAIHGDGDALALARRYFAQYPNGEFTDQVRRVVRDAAATSK